jgi:hypothetical protein
MAHYKIHGLSRRQAQSHLILTNKRNHTEHHSLVIFLTPRGVLHWSLCCDNIAAKDGEIIKTSKKGKQTILRQQGFDTIFKYALETAHGQAASHETLLFICDGASIHNDTDLNPIIEDFTTAHPNSKVKLYVHRRKP